MQSLIFFPKKYDNKIEELVFSDSTVRIKIKNGGWVTYPYTKIELTNPYNGLRLSKRGYVGDYDIKQYIRVGNAKPILKDVDFGTKTRPITEKEGARFRQTTTKLQQLDRENMKRTMNS